MNQLFRVSPSRVNWGEGDTLYNGSMQVTAFQTEIFHPNDSLFSAIEKSIVSLPERSILAVTSKIVALAENRVVPLESIEKHELVRQEADRYLDPHSSKYDLMLTMKNTTMAVNAGIDESNVDGQYVLWPKDIQESTNATWRWAREHYGVKELGVIQTDSKTFPLRWGIIGTTIAHCGFKALNTKIGTPDLFGRPMKMTQVNVAEAVGVAAVFEMGEANERTPLAVITGIKEITFQDREPTNEELDFLNIEPEDDAYAPILMSAQWQRGGGGK